MVIRIVVTQELDLLPDQIDRLKKLGELKIHNDLAKTPEEWMARVAGYDVICTGKFGFRDKVHELRDVFISVPFVGTGSIDTKQTSANNVTISRAPGCNKDAVSEWVVMMTLASLRNLPYFMNALDLPKGVVPKPDRGASHSSVTVLGAGNIGSRVGAICEALEMKVRYFRRGDDLEQAVEGSDVVIDSLSHNTTTDGLLDKAFFSWLKPSAHFISVTGSEIFSVDALIEALDDSKIAGAALDAGGIQVGDSYDPHYRRLAEHPKIIATPHIAYNTERTSRVGNDMMIDNIESWINDKPQNIVDNG